MMDPAAQPPTESSACPKCGKTRVEGAASCPRCGLVFAANLDPAALRGPTLDTRAGELWAVVLRDFASTESHDAFLKYCSVSGLLAAAGRQYRDYLDQHPADAVALKMQQRVVGMAMALLPPPSPPKPPVTRSKWFWVVVVGAALVAGLAGIFFTRLR